MSCLQEYLKDEQMQQGEEWKCSGCHKKVLARKTLRLFHTSEIVTLHFKRFRNNRTKITTPVEFPVEGFNLAPFMSASSDVSAHTMNLVRHKQGVLRTSGYSFCEKPLGLNFEFAQYGSFITHSFM